MRRFPDPGAIACLIGLCLCAPRGQAGARAAAPNPTLPVFDFRQGGGLAGWVPLHDVSRFEATREGMAITISGPDPYVAGPPGDYPPGWPLIMKIRCRSSQGGSFQVFYVPPGQTESEENSVNFTVRRGVWQDQAVILPPQGPGVRLRLDPPGAQGTCQIAWIYFTPALNIATPGWPTPTLPAPGPLAHVVRGGALELRHDPRGLGEFTVSVEGRLTASGHNRPVIIAIGPQGPDPAFKYVYWLDIAELPKTVTNHFDPVSGIFAIQVEFTDPGSGRWKWRQVFRPRAEKDAGIAVEVECSCSLARELVFVPLFLLLPGHGSFGTLKGQGLFAGVEYLENEPSSSTADLNPPGSNRKVPQAAKLTFPLAAVQAHGRYVGLIWEEAAGVCAVFDSPDRVFGTDGHLMGLLAPGASGGNREDGALLPVAPLSLPAGHPVHAMALIIGGKGESVVPAIEAYVAIKGLPERPRTTDLAAYVRLAASGWLDTPIRSNHLFRHAASETIEPHPAADAAWMMAQLAALCDEPALRSRLESEAAAAALFVPPAAQLHAGVSQNRYPVTPLLMATGIAPAAALSGNVVAAPPAPLPPPQEVVQIGMEQARGIGQAALSRFEPDGRVRYERPKTGLDFSRTHFCDESNGQTAELVARLLDAAVFAGDRELAEEGLRLLRILQRRFAHGVPRGAQTWEIPLHTPDILASAYLVRAAAVGFELTGDPTLLGSARHWAWTGVPFVYLRKPAELFAPDDVGLYATVPVLGASNWVAPNWIGTPVQWCGLVYADALLLLARHDPKGPWRTLSEGITASGLAQTYPADHPKGGLLPDSFVLRSQTRNPVDINPGTLQVLALRHLGGDRPAATPYQFRALRGAGLWVHAPGAIEIQDDQVGSAQFLVRPWSPRPSLLLMHAETETEAGKARALATVRLDGQPAALDGPLQPLAHRGTLLFELKPGKPVVVSVVRDGR